jgi:hypothetical protein
MKFDYSKAMKLVNKVPNLSQTFNTLPGTRRQVKKILNKRLNYTQRDLLLQFSLFPGHCFFLISQI